MRGEWLDPLCTDRRARDLSGREIVSVKEILEWAFAVECATLDFDEVGAVAGNGWNAVSATAGVCDAMALATEQDAKERPGACVRVDVSLGRSYCHDDAETVATILRNAVAWHVAMRVAEISALGEMRS